MIEIRADDERTYALWSAVLDLADAQPDGWTLIGAQMVSLHGFERARQHGRVSLDADVLADVRLVDGGPRRLAETLERVGFHLVDATTDGIGHRFARGDIRFDLLAPEGLGRKVDLTTVPPNRTISVPGGSQALERTVPVQVRLANRTGAVRRPDLLGAILVKARAVDVDDAKESQRRDLAFLLSLCEDPAPLEAAIRRSERGWLRRRRELVDPDHPAWRDLPNAPGGRDTLRILARA